MKDRLTKGQESVKIFTFIVCKIISLKIYLKLEDKQYLSKINNTLNLTLHSNVKLRKIYFK